VLLLNRSFFEQEPLLFLKGAVIFAIGPLNHQLSYLFIAMFIDLIFEGQVARKEGQFKLPSLMKKFWGKVFTYVLWIAMFHAFDGVTGLPDTARLSLIIALVGLEIVSATKNTAKLGHNKLAETLGNLYLSLTKNKGGSTDEESANDEDPNQP
jgi:phage-related holin